jgi:integral membrane protein (TIGR00529 family)
LIQVIGLIVSLIIIILLVVKRVSYGIALLIGTLVLGVFSQLNPQQFLEVFTLTLTDWTTLDLVLIISLIPILALSMDKTGMVNNLIISIRKAFSGRAVLVTLPALMGALPMPGGALLSAPLIDKEAERHKLAGEEKSFINIWFRHWLFFIYPLEPALILAATITNIGLYELILIQAPSLILYLFLGYFVSVRRVSDDNKDEQRRDLKTLLSIPLNMSPILLVVILNIFGMHMAAALAMGVALVLIFKKVNPRRAASILRRGFNWKLPLAIIGVMSLRHMIVYTDVLSEILPYLKAIGLSTIVLLIIISWAIGLATAMPEAGIAIILPIALVLIKDVTPIMISILYLAVIFSYIISPMHLCLVLTVEYYRSRLLAVYRKLIPTAVATYLIILIVSMLI